jgi:UDP-glucose 4-epimerase
LIIENLLRDLSNHKKFSVINLRYFNPVWAHKSWLIWEDPNDIPNNLLPYIMKVATWELKEIQVFGNDYNTKDWTGERDYIHVLDLIDGHIKALEYIEINSPLLDKRGAGGELLKNIYEEINLWTGNATSVLEMISLTKKVTNKDLNYKIVNRRSWDVAISYCSPIKAKNLLNWEAKYSVEEAIEDSYHFIIK